VIRYHNKESTIPVNRTVRPQGTSQSQHECCQAVDWYSPPCLMYATTLCGR